MIGRVPMLAAVLVLAACAGREAEAPDAGGPAAPEPPGLGEVAMTFSGLLPCADCADEELVITLFPDGSFRLRSTFFGEEAGAEAAVFYDLGRWTREPDEVLRLDSSAGAARVFRLQSRDSLVVLDAESPASPGVNAPALILRALVDPVAGPMPLRGLYTYLADAAVFEECQTGRRFPVIIDGAHLELERAYLENRPAPGEPLLVTLEGRFELREPEPGLPEREHVRVVEFGEVWPGQSCDGPQEPGAPPAG